MTYGHLQAKFAKSCTDAAFGYARAATAAYVNLAGQSVDFWANSVRAASQGQAEATAPAAPATPFDFWMSASNDWMKAWGSLMPANAMPASWPMAYGFMSAGVPSSVAWPVAEANAAVLDAAEAATETINQTFSSYRSTTGYATAQISFPSRLQTLLLCAAPFSAALAFPWMLAAQRTA